jgi:hypothetical protein
MRLLLALLTLAMLAGCTRSESQAQSVEVTRTTGTENGKPVDLTTVKRSQSETQTTAGIDPQAIASAVSTAVSAAIPGADAIGKAVAESMPKPEKGVGWAEVAGGAGALATTIATGYLAVAKRGQIRQGKKP